MEYYNNFRELTRDVIFTPKPNYVEKDYPDLHGHVYVVTGASSGIGFESAKLLLAKGARVYITGRTPEKIKTAMEELGAIGDVKLLPIHHEDLKTVAPAIRDFLQQETKLNGVVHNAGINYRGQNVLEPYGLLDIIVINVLASQLIQQLLLPVLKTTPNSRTIWVTSAIHYHSPITGIVYSKEQGFVDEDINVYDSGGYLGKGNGMYGQTKAMNIYQAIQWGKRYPDVISVAAHPGAIVSDIRRHNSWRAFVLGSISQPTIYGAYQVVQTLLSPEITLNDNGGYYVPFGLKARVRPDVREAAEGEEGKEFWTWINKKIEPYL